jgi:Bacteriophage probable baseplate hub protein
MTSTPVEITSPVFSVDGTVVGELARDCVSLRVSEGIAGLRTLEARFLAVAAGVTGPPDGLLYLDGQSVDLGKAVTVSLGPESEQRYVFDGAVSALELILPDGEPPQVVVLAEDAMMRLRMTHRRRTYTDVTDADVVSSIAHEQGLDADVQADGPRYDVLQQVNQSDLAFLRDRARFLQAELWCTGRTLHFRTRANRQGTPVTLVHGSELISVRFCADLAHQRSEVVVTGYDAGQRQGVSESAGPDVIEGEATQGRTGARLVSQALGESSSCRVRDVALSSEEANAWARAEMLRRGRRFVSVSGATIGTPDLVVGSRLTLKLVGEPFEGDGYYVTQVTHSFDLRHGFRTLFEAQRSTLNEVA